MSLPKLMHEIFIFEHISFAFFTSFLGRLGFFHCLNLPSLLVATQTILIGGAELSCGPTWRIVRDVEVDKQTVGRWSLVIIITGRELRDVCPKKNEQNYSYLSYS